mmetsp:Transcript_36168/g.103881  ORF Transcript_36168/g.103881 Transcript_36168/m.103881 type:complete len:215 (+) Transcript_36168:3-647(+)
MAISRNAFHEQAHASEIEERCLTCDSLVIWRPLSSDTSTAPSLGLEAEDREEEHEEDQEEELDSAHEDVADPVPCQGEAVVPPTIMPSCASEPSEDDAEFDPAVSLGSCNFLESAYWNTQVSVLASLAIVAFAALLSRSFFPFACLGICLFGVVVVTDVRANAQPKGETQGKTKCEAGASVPSDTSQIRAVGTALLTVVASQLLVFGVGVVLSQ